MITVPESPKPAVATARLGYVPALDGLRGIAVLLVMGYHFRVPYFQAGFLGVDIFFVLSGFLITSLLVQEWQQSGQINLRNFYIKRVLRLWPALFFVLGVFYPLWSLAEIALALTNSLNWPVSFDPFSIGRHPIAYLWTLSVEWQFYLVWPLFLRFALRRLPRYVIIGVPCVFAILSALERFLLWHLQLDWNRVFFATDTRAGGLLIGSALALVLSWHSLNRVRSYLKLLAFLAVVILLAVLVTQRDQVPSSFIGSFDATALSTAALILIIMLNPATRLVRALGVGPLALVGRISYGLYLWHLPIFIFVVGFIWPIGTLAAVLACFAASFTFAFLSYRYLERPISRFRPKITRQNNDPDEAGAVAGLVTSSIKPIVAGLLTSNIKPTAANRRSSSFRG